MVCIVHDRQFLSKFHATINELRRTNEFTVLTLRQLPKQSCSCLKPQNSLTSIDIDHLRLLCLRSDLKQYIALHGSSTRSSTIEHYKVLSFPLPLNLQQQEKLLNDFVIQQKDQLDLLQKIHHVHLQFISSTTSNDLLKEILQFKYDLALNSKNYQETIEAICGAWVIISVDDQSHLDLVNHSLEKQWRRFITNIHIPYTNTMYSWKQGFLPEIERKKRSKRVKILGKKKTKILITFAHQIRTSSESIEMEERDVNNDLAEDLLMADQKFRFLQNRFENRHQTRSPRTHRRQHLLAIAMAA